MKKLLINAHIVTVNENFDVIKRGYILIDNENIVDIGDMNNLVIEDDVFVDDIKNNIVIPGLINTHTHLGMIPFRSMADDMVDRLRKFLFPMEKKYMSKELAVTSSGFAAYELIKTGITTVADMYYYQKDVAKELLNIGIRAYCGQTVIKDDACDGLTEAMALKYTEEYIKDYHSNKLVKPMIAPHGTNTVSKDTLINAKNLSNKYDIKMMMHVSEMTYEVEYFKNNYNMTPIEYLDSHKILDSNFILVHSIYTNDKDIEILRDTNTNVVHCITANMKSGKGFMNLKKMLDNGINVSIGTDGPVSGNTLDLFTQMRLIPMVHKTINQDRNYLTSRDVLKMATINGAITLGINDRLGSIEKGKLADLTVIDIADFNMFPIHDVYSVIVYSAQSHNVRSTMVNGKWLYKDYKFINDKVRIYKKKLTELIAPIAKEYARIK